jgi:hypothetical protein
LLAQTTEIERWTKLVRSLNLNLLDQLRALDSAGIHWKESDKPIVVANGRAYSFRAIDKILEVPAAYVVGVNQTHLTRLCRFLRTETVHFYEMRVDDLAPLEQIGALVHLAIRWNPKVVNLTPLGRLARLRSLILEDTPKAQDLTPLRNLEGLQAFEFSGGISTKNTARSLEPIAALPTLAELRLHNLRVLESGLAPLASCKSLRKLSLSNQFDTADYALLAAALPETQCEHLAAFVHLSPPTIDDKDTMVVGKGKPFLNSDRDKERLEKYRRDFARLRQEALQRLR